MFCLYKIMDITFQMTDNEVNFRPDIGDSYQAHFSLTTVAYNVSASQNGRLKFHLVKYLNASEGSSLCSITGC